MVRRRFSRWFSAVCVGAPLLALVATSCSVPDFQFEQPQLPPLGQGGDVNVVIDHCVNGLLDSELGESDYDCGGGCEPCALSQHCSLDADCIEGICSTGTCISEGCRNRVQDAGETDVDCGGGCSACITGQGCAEDGDCASQVCDEAKCLAPACDDQTTNGKETGLDCGADCAPCPANEPCLSGADCLSAQCNANVCGPVCADGFADCDKLNENDCEIGIRTDAVNCGACGNVCSLPHAASECSAGECRIVTGGCDAGWEDCNGLPEDGCEVNHNTDKLNCGACNKACPELNGAPFCDAGACEITCSKGFADCDDERANGCEKDVSKDVNNCGLCGKKCVPAQGGTAYCKDDTCGETVCPTGFGDCNGEPGDGCEVDLRTDDANCNTCGNLCLVANGAGACVNRQCGILSCIGSYDDCMGGYADGCETNTDTSTSHCGGCGDPCSVANGSAKCDGGACAIGSCSGTFRDCNSDPANGCETNIATSQTNCGGCGASGSNCNTKYPNATSTCGTSACSAPVCKAGFGDCSGGTLDGCETDTTLTPSHCGACLQACQSGAAAHVSSNLCSMSMCVPVCSGSYRTCDSDKFNGCEANSNDDENNCGACGSVCSSAASAHVTSNLCVGSSCDPQCVGTYRDCNANENDGCETNSATSSSHCGGCNLACRVDAAAHVSSNLCSGSSCQPVCNGLYDDCDGMPENGCEKPVGVDKNNCGSCGTSCGTTHASTTACSGGTCAPSCDAGWGACSSPENGCTTPLGTTSNCTSCGQSCSGGTPFCIAGSGCADHLDIEVGNLASGGNGWNGSSNPIHTLKHTLKWGPGNSRMVLVGVTGTDTFLDAAGVSYAGNPMTLFPAGTSAVAEGSSYAGIYYILDADLPAAGLQNDVVVTFAASNLWGMGAADVLELRNVQQVAPIAGGTHSSAQDCAELGTRSTTVTFTQTGSLVYGILMGRNGNAGSLPGSFTQTLNHVQTTPAIQASIGGYIFDNNDRTIDVSMTGCWSAAGAAVAIRRREAP